MHDARPPSFNQAELSNDPDEAALTVVPGTALGAIPGARLAGRRRQEVADSGKPEHWLWTLSDAHAPESVPTDWKVRSAPAVPVSCHSCARTGGSRRA